MSLFMLVVFLNAWFGNSPHSAARGQHATAKNKGNPPIQLTTQLPGLLPSNIFNEAAFEQVNNPEPPLKEQDSGKGIQEIYSLSMN